MSGSLEVVKELIAFGGDELLMTCTKDGHSCLAVACQQGHLHIIKFLLDNGGDKLLEHTSTENRTCLLAAVDNEREEVVEYLLGICSERLLLTRTIRGANCLHGAASINNARILHLLIVAGAPLESTTPCGFTCLHVAAKFGNTDAIRYLWGRLGVWKDLKVGYGVEMGWGGGGASCMARRKQVQRAVVRRSWCARCLATGEN
jgi:ankyrin repeat protein